MATERVPTTKPSARVNDPVRVRRTAERERELAITRANQLIKTDDSHASGTPGFSAGRTAPPECAAAGPW